MVEEQNNKQNQELHRDDEKEEMNEDETRIKQSVKKRKRITYREKYKRKSEELKRKKARWGVKKARWLLKQAKWKVTEAKLKDAKEKTEMSLKRYGKNLLELYDTWEENVRTRDESYQLQWWSQTMMNLKKQRQIAVNQVRRSLTTLTIESDSDNN